MEVEVESVRWEEVEYEEGVEVGRGFAVGWGRVWGEVTADLKGRTGGFTCS